MEIYKIMECHNQDGRHVCGGRDCVMYKYVTNHDKAVEWAKEKLCPIICRCVQKIKVEEF